MLPVLPVPLILGALERAVLCVPTNIFDDIALYIGDSISISVPFAAIVHKFAAALQDLNSEDIQVSNRHRRPVQAEQQFF
jgi:hypothetical protein